MKLLAKWQLNNITATNRIVRSATFENAADKDGNPQMELADIYCKLALNNIGTIITGFTYISRQGRAMHPFQCGIDCDSKILPWKQITQKVKSVSPDTILLMQLSHAGCQTLTKITGFTAIAPSGVKSSYFRCRPVKMSEAEINITIDEFAQAAKRAKEAGFNGVQLHGAHGYLIHQFLSPYYNTRDDKWSENRFLFLDKIIARIKDLCGISFPIFVKLSADGNHIGGITPALTARYIKLLEIAGIDAVEISYGTMDNPFNIFRGKIPADIAMRHNILFTSMHPLQRWLWKKFCLKHFIDSTIPFERNYNLKHTQTISQLTGMPLILVGGVRDIGSAEEILNSNRIAAISMCRPLICQPDIITRFIEGKAQTSSCTNCNICAVMSDSTNIIRCYRKETNHEYNNE